MLDRNKYKGKKKFDFKKWITGGNSKIYLFLMLLVLAFCIFSLNTVIKMHEDNLNKENNQTSESEANTASQEESSSDESNYIAKNLSYCIKINKTKNIALIYEMDDKMEYTKLVKAFLVSVPTDIKTGETSISKKSLWWKVSNVSYCQYASKLENGEALYSASYYYNETNNSINRDSYNNIGKPSLDGSIHMTVANAKWIYKVICRKLA